MEKTKNIAIFAGKFDPFTLGHYDTVKRASQLFDKVIIAVANDSSSMAKADVNCRCQIVNQSVSELANVQSEAFSGLLSDYLKQKNAKYLIRGMRSSVDFEYENSLFRVYKSLNPEIETIFFISSHNVSHISATIVRELAALGASLDGYVCPNASTLIKKVYT